MMHVVALHHGWMKEHRRSNASSHAHKKSFLHQAFSKVPAKANLLKKQVTRKQ
jgi:hypothetical protein